MSSRASPASCSMPMNTSRRSVSCRNRRCPDWRPSGCEQAAPLVKANGRGRDTGTSRDLPDRQQLVHATT